MYRLLEFFIVSWPTAVAAPNVRPLSDKLSFPIEGLAPDFGSKTAALDAARLVVANNGQGEPLNLIAVVGKDDTIVELLASYNGGVKPWKRGYVIVDNATPTVTVTEEGADPAPTIVDVVPDPAAGEVSANDAEAAPPAPTKAQVDVPPSLRRRSVLDGKPPRADVVD